MTETCGVPEVEYSRTSGSGVRDCRMCSGAGTGWKACLVLTFAICLSLLAYVVVDFRVPVVRQRISSVLTAKPQEFSSVRVEDKNFTLPLGSKCKDGYKVPPIVHYIWLWKETMEIHEYISVLSMSKFVKPCYILLHGNRVPAGKWWDLLLSQVKNIIHVYTDPPKVVFGRPIGYLEHKADVLRLQILMKYGGIYADTDLYALRSFDPLRNYMMTLGREDSHAVANGIILANKDAPLLKIWMLSYHSYNKNSWGGNSVLMANQLSGVLPSLVHLEQHSMVMLGNRYQAVYEDNLSWDNTQYSVHLYARFFKKRNYEIDELKHLDNTYGALSRYVLFGNRTLMRR